MNQASGVQSNLPTTVKHGRETRPWRSLSGMFTSISQSRDALFRELKIRQKEHLIARIDVELLNEVVTFVSVFPTLFDVLEYANVATLQNALPVFYTLYERWQAAAGIRQRKDFLMKREFLKVLNDKYWGSLRMLHFVASFLDPTLRHFRFVKKLNDRDGFFKQIRESLATLASEVSTVPVNC